ncbi:hypothetical protein HDV05_001352, partial [Chytridiales sp. JEL 0842]
MDGLKATEEIRKIECERAFADQQHRKSSSPSSTDSNATLDDNSPSSLSNSDDDFDIGRRRRLTIIGISGNAREQSLQNALGKGMDGYITKPWKKEDIYRDKFLCKMVTAYLSTALHSGEAAMMCSSLRNIHSVQILLEAQGINVSWAIKIVCVYGDLVGGMVHGSLQPNSAQPFGNRAVELETIYQKF